MFPSTSEDNGEYTLEGIITDELGAFSKWKVLLEVLGFPEPIVVSLNETGYFNTTIIEEEYVNKTSEENTTDTNSTDEKSNPIGCKPPMIETVNLKSEKLKD